ncbi:UNVERIFIED_CONTAM: Oligouridylate-binding protein 1 [Sesamum radiatum]|uniref:Oligouridylate-binding protein 1 n=1 Tax=Sesamum radiatum TaxID=300843 RepID=A0AAW2LAP2_SESRA
MMQQQRLKQQQALMQQSLYHPGLLAPAQLCWQYSPQVTELLLQEVFSSAGPLEGCKLIRKDKLVDLSFDILCKLNLAVQHISTFSSVILAQRLNSNTENSTNPSLYYNRDARVMWDQKTGRSRGFGFVSFRNKLDAQSAINDMNGKWLGTRQIRCNWATKSAGLGDDQQSSDSKNIVELTNGSSEDGQEKRKEDGPENNPQYTTVYVGNLAPEVTLVDLHRHFHALGAGTIEDVRIQRDKGFGFIRYSSHAEAARAIKMGNARIFFGKPIKCSWGSKPTPPGTSSALYLHQPQLICQVFQPLTLLHMEGSLH